MMIDAVLLDLSGVLYDGDELMPGALAAGNRICASVFDVSRALSVNVAGRISA